MGRNKTNNATVSTPVVNSLIDTVLDPQIAASVTAEQHEDKNAAPAEALAETPTDTVKLIVVRSVSTAGGQKAANVVPIPEAVMTELKELGLNKVNEIKTLFASKFSRAQIVAAGYNSSTVYRQVAEYIKSLATVKADKAEIRENAETLVEATGEGEVIADADLDAMEETEA